MINISVDQISACETLILLEDLYIQRIEEQGNSVESRNALIPLRNSIEYLKKSYNITNTVRSDYDKYIRLIRASLIYGDMLNKIQDTDDGINDKAV